MGERAHIERVGAAATLIWEEWEKRGHGDALSPASTNLLLLAILQNTLNFTSTETNTRDTQAFEELLTRASLPEGWQDRYFAECAEGIHAHLDETLKNDTKILPEYLGDRTLVFSQLEITEDPKEFLNRYKKNIDAYWATFKNTRCLINIADMRSGTSLLYANDPEWLHATVLPLFEKSIEISADKIIVPIHQRKEIHKLFLAR